MNRSRTAPRALFGESHRRLGWALIALRIRVFRNSLALHRRQHRVRAATTYFVVCPALFLFTLLLTVVIASGLGSMHNERAATAVLAALLTVATIGSFVGASTTALQALYLSDDVPFLLTLPIPLRVLFVGKFSDSAVGALPACILLVSALTGYGFARTSSDVYFLAAGGVAVTLVVGATAAAIATVSTVTRFVPPRRARGYLFLIAMVMIFAAMLAWRYAAPSSGDLGGSAEEARYAALYDKLIWLPTGWAADGLARFGSGDIEGGAIGGLFFVAFTLALLGLAFEAFSRTFFDGLARTRAVQLRNGAGALSRLAYRLGNLLPAGVGPTVTKEWLSLFRDLRRMSGAIWPVGVVILYSLMLERRGPGTTASPELRFWSANATLALLPWGLSLGVSLYAFGSEGRNIGLLRALPISPRRLLLGKAIASARVVLVLSEATILLGLALRGASLVHVLELGALVAWMATGFVLIDTAASAVAPAFRATQIQRSIALPGRAFSLVFGAAFGIFTAIAVARLVLWTTPPPEELGGLLDLEVGGLRLLGWPLVTAAFAGALLAVGLAVRIAIGQTARLLRDGD